MAALLVNDSAMVCAEMLVMAKCFLAMFSLKCSTTTITPLCFSFPLHLASSVILVSPISGTRFPAASLTISARKTNYIIVITVILLISGNYFVSTIPDHWRILLY